MIKKRYGSVLVARYDSTQKVNLITKLIAHNITISFVYLLFDKGFNIAEISSIYK